GPGNDQFFFDTALNSVTNVDHVTDFSHRHDKIVLSKAIFPGIGGLGTLAAAHFHVGASAQTPGQHIIYNPGNGVLSFDANGSAAGGVTRFAVLDHHPPLTHNDFIVEA